MSKTTADVLKKSGELEGKLKGKMFVGGNRPSEDDVKLFNELLGKDNGNVQRWVKNMVSYTEAERKAFGAPIAPVATPAPSKKHEDPVPASTEDNSTRFHRVYKEIQQHLLDDAQKRMAVDDNRRKYLQKMMDVTVLGGKYNRGLTVVEVGDTLSKDITGAAREQYLNDCCVAGWLIEMMQAHFLVEDDIMDSSITRRGKPCWYRHPGVTTQCAINDGLIILAWCTKTATHFFAQRPFLAKVLELFHDVDYRTTIGQLYDVSSMYDSAKLDPDVKQPTTTDYMEFTLHHYNRIVKYKTAYYTYFVPMALGLAVCGALPTSKVDIDTVEEIACIMGEYFQVQDDFLDCFGDPALIGKIGTDIQDTKCSWLAVTFLATASEEQKEKFKANYGDHDEAKVATIKQLFKDTKLTEKFEVYEAETVTKVEKLLGQIRGEAPEFAAAVDKLWAKTYKRQK